MNDAWVAVDPLTSFWGHASDVATGFVAPMLANYRVGSLVFALLSVSLIILVISMLRKGS